LAEEEQRLIRAAQPPQRNSENPISPIKTEEHVKYMEGLVYPEKYEKREDFTKMALSHEIDFMTDAMKRGQLIPRVMNYGVPKRTENLISR